MSETKNSSFKEIELGVTGLIVAANVERIRKDSKLTYSDLSAQLNKLGHPIPPLGLRRIEARARRVTVDDLLALAHALNVPPARLLLGPSSQSPFGTTIPEEVNFSEMGAWMEGRLEDFKLGNRLQYWQGVHAKLTLELEALRPRFERTKIDLAKNPNNALQRMATGYLERQIERATSALAEAESRASLLQLKINEEYENNG